MIFLNDLILNALDKFQDILSWILYNVALLLGPIVDRRVKKLLEETGFVINGKEPWSMQIHDPRFYAKLVGYGDVGFGETYMDGWWSVQEFDTMLIKAFQNGSRDHISKHHTYWIGVLQEKFLYRGSKARQVKGSAHYKLGAEFFNHMFDSDPYMNYSCGYWVKGGKNKDLGEAQLAKMNLIGQKLKLKPGMKVLDIGIGFGGIDKYLAETFGVSVVGYTLSKDMAGAAQRMCEGLPVEVRIADFRDITGTYDAAFSLEMIEHVGYKNLAPYFEIINKCLVKDGLFLLQVNMVDGPAEIPSYNPYLDKYLFFCHYAPRLEDIVAVTRGLFVIEDLHNWGINHYHTFKAWDDNFVKHWPKISALSKSEYDDKFYRFFRGYLLGSAATHFARIIQLEQIVFSKTGLEGGYESVR